MLTLGQIVLRLIFSLIFGLVIFLFRKEKEKIFARQIYLLISLGSAFLAIFSLKIFLSLYSKIDLILLPVVLTLGIFIIGRDIIQKEKIKEATDSLIFLWLTSLIGLTLGFGFYELAIFATILILIISIFNSFLKIWLKK